MKGLQMKSMQTLMFNPGGFKGRLRACPFLGTWRALLCGEVLILERLVVIWSILFTEGEPLNIIFRSEIQVTRTHCGRLLFFP